MNRRQFIGLVAGIAATRSLPPCTLAVPLQKKCQICGETIWAGEEVINQGGPHARCARDAHPLYWWGIDGIRMLVKINGNPKPGELLYWDRSNPKKAVVQTVQYRDTKNLGWLVIAGAYEGMINDTGWGWVKVSNL